MTLIIFSHVTGELISGLLPFFSHHSNVRLRLSWCVSGECTSPSVSIGTLRAVPIAEYFGAIRANKVHKSLNLGQPMEQK